MKTLLKLFLSLLLVLSVGDAWAAGPYYVRTNGSTGTNCTGLANADYDGSGTGEACAFNSPLWVIPLETSSTVSESTTLATGETVVIVNGSYRIGCQDATDCVDASHNTKVGACGTSATYDCDPRPLPNNVTIVGCTTSGCGCTYGWGGIKTCTTTPPELWGAGNIQEVIDASGSTGVTIKDIEITDHANCNTFTPFTCRNPDGISGMSDKDNLAAQFGINATSATHLTLTGVNIHGVGYEAMRVTNVNGMTITGSNFDYTAVGMNNDNTGSCTTCGLSGTIKVTKSSMNGNGCIEDWQNDGTIVNHTCCSQTQGCSSAEGISMSNTGGNWILEDDDFSYNTADGVDLLYLNRGIYSGGSLTFNRIRAEGNAGNSTKGPNAQSGRNSFLIGDCGFFQGLVRTYSNGTFDHCRSNTGNPINIEFKSGDTTLPTFYNNTITSNGDVVYNISGTCPTGTDVVSQGNVILGGKQWNDDSTNPLANGGAGDDLTSLFYDATGEGGTCDVDNVEDYNTFVGEFKGGDPHTGTHSVYTATLSNVFSGTALQGPYSGVGYFGSINYHNVLYLKSGSTALGISNEVGTDSLDFNSFNRGSAWDGGAVEFGSTGEVLCGNGVIDSGEQCDGSLLNGQSCTSNGFDEGSLGCTSGCEYDFSGCSDFCGNGTIETGEECDGTNFNGESCTTQGFESGNLSCDGCLINTTACFTDPCGNGNIDSPEECDGTNLNAHTCQSEGFTYGTPTCLADCTLDTSGCSNPSCGNSLVEAGEQCDTANLNSKTCTTQGFDSGTLACNGNCTFNTSACAYNCGNGTIEAPEACDGVNLNSKTCITQGFDGGTLSCTPSCTLNTSACTVATCGNNVIEGSEVCDGTALNSQNCITKGFDSGTLFCTNCAFNTAACAYTQNTNSKMIIGGKITAGGVGSIQ